MKAFSIGAVAALAVSIHPWFTAAAVELELNVTAITDTVDAGWSSVHYSDSPLLLGNDGETSTGGFYAFDLDGNTPLPLVKSVANGRTGLVSTVHGVGGEDYLLTIATADSLLRAFQLPDLVEKEEAQFWALGDWSSLCSWRSDAGDQYVFLFGKEQAVQILIRSRDGSLEMVEVQSFPMPWEATGCAVSNKAGRLYLSSALDDNRVYYFSLAESTETPEISTLGEAKDPVTGLAVYVSNADSDYIFVAQENAIEVYTQDFELLGTLEMTGLEELEIEGLSLHQAATSKYPAGALAYAFEADDDVAGFGVSSLEGISEELGFSLHTEYHPGEKADNATTSPICKKCSGNGYCGTKSECSCFAGFTGATCCKVQCTDDCSGHGQCVGPNQCKCDAGWGGLHCSFLVIEPSYETEAHGADGDDPAIWISPEAPEKSRVITTTKSTEGAGLAVFDLGGKLLQHMPAGEPNNVDMIYDFPVGDRKVDLAFAACREDDTLCLFEMLPNGTLADIPGGVQPVVDDYTVYGSCVYRSPKSGKQYLFVNEKSARYLQYELTSTSNGTLQTTLVRDFTGGSGGQVEGCVTDEQNGWIFLGEEPSALWRYGAEPDSEEEGHKVAYVGDGTMHAEVEGVTLVVGDAPDKGFVIVSNQGVSSYNVYRRAEPHEYVATFTISESSDGQIDAVTNTDGVTAVGTALGRDFPRGLLVVHDDSNELPGGSTSDESSFKLISLERVLGAEALESMGLLDEVDASWSPRA